MRKKRQGTRTTKWQDGTWDAYGGNKQGPADAPYGDDNYKEVEGHSYQDFIAEGPYGFRDHDGIPIEMPAANPDILAETGETGLNTTEILAEARSCLTAKQLSIWDLVMVQGMTATMAAEILGISQQTVSKQLAAAKLRFSNYLRTVHERD